MHLRKLKMLFPIILTLSLAHAQEVRTGEDVLRGMHDHYAKTWYETLTFTQKSTTYKADGTSSSETWHEALKVPGKLRIDIGNPSDGNGYLMVDGTLTIVKDNKVAGTRPLVNMALVLGFDVYRQTPETTASVIKGEGYDLTKVHDDTWEGQPVYVVGAAKGDLKAKQFWVDKKNWLFVRMLEPTQSDAPKFQDIRFEDYRQMAGGWVAARVDLYVEDKKVFGEEYSDIQCNAKLAPGTFDATQFSSTHWEKP